VTALQRDGRFQNFPATALPRSGCGSSAGGEDLIRKVLTLATTSTERSSTTGRDRRHPVRRIAAIDRKLRVLLESEGVTTIDAAAGRPSILASHEAIANVPDPNRAEGEIVEEVRRGYRLRDRVIRPLSCRGHIN